MNGVEPGKDYCHPERDASYFVERKIWAGRFAGSPNSADFALVGVRFAAARSAELTAKGAHPYSPSSQQRGASS
jgi:hypothetical protein